MPQPEWLEDHWPGGSIYQSYKPAGSAPTIGSITGVEMADGRGFLLWTVDAAEVHGAVFDMPEVFCNDNIVQAPNDVTFLSGFSPGKARAFTVGGDLFFSVCYRWYLTNTGYVQIYKANDPLDPLAGFSLYADIEPPTAIPPEGSFYSGQQARAGVPYITASGRWVYAGDYWMNAGFNQFINHFGVWTSDNGGASWTRRMDDGNTFAYYDNNPGQVIRSPVDGYLYAFVRWSTVSVNHRMWFSTDEGNTWNFSFDATYNNGWTLPNGAFLCGYNNDILFIDSQNSVNQPRMVTLGPNYMNGTDLNDRDLNGTGITYGPMGYEMDTHPVLMGSGSNRRLFLFNRETVQMAGGGFYIDEIGMG